MTFPANRDPLESQVTGALAALKPRLAPPNPTAVKPACASEQSWAEFLARGAPPESWDAGEVSRQYGLWVEACEYRARNRQSHEEQLARLAAEPPPPPTAEQRIATLEAEGTAMRVRLAAIEDALKMPKRSKLGRIPGRAA